MRLDLTTQIARHHAMSPAVTEVDHKPDQQPSTQPQPIFRRQREHQEHTRKNPKDGYQRHERRAEGPMSIRMCVPHNQYRRANDHERQQRSDVYQIGKDSERQQ